MEYLFPHIGKIEELLRNKFILLLLDYDGTLTPIRDAPGEALMYRQAKEVLLRLSNISGCKIGIISGRSVHDIKKIVGIEKIVYAGNHGLELDGPKIKFKFHISKRLKSIMRNIKTQLLKKLSGIKGVLIEDKGVSISVHYRLIGQKDINVFKKIFFEVSGPYAEGGKIKIDSGKKVYEIKPPVEWDKGKIALWLLARQEFALGENKVMAIYAGDDAADENVFKALRGKGLTIFIGGKSKSSASYYLRNSQELIKFLSLILKLRG